MDQLGIGVSIYFKLLKSMICLLLISFVICIPVMVIYSSQQLSNQGMLQKSVSMTFLGNIGEYSHKCIEHNILESREKQHYKFELTCPRGQYFNNLVKFGLQTSNQENDVCVTTPVQKKINLHLDPQCGFFKDNPDES